VHHLVRVIGRSVFDDCKLGHARSPLVCGRPELQVLAVLRAARPVVEVGPLVAAVGDRREGKPAQLDDQRREGVSGEPKMLPV
jgi:hypothetical protein